MSDNVKHTAEPWHLGVTGIAVYDASSDWVGATAPRIGELIPSDTAKANARRIVACVNACTGVRTETLERVPLNLSTEEMVERIEDAEKQRDHFKGLAEHRGRSIDNLLNIQGKQSTEIERLCQQRDQLLAALEALMLFTKPSKSNAAALANAYTAIDAAKGGAVKQAIVRTGLPKPNVPDITLPDGTGIDFDPRKGGAA